MNHVIGRKPNLYEILGLRMSASQEEIYHRYEILCKRNEMLQRMDPWLPIQEDIIEETRAYLILSEPNLRKKYDKSIDFDIVVLDKEIDKTDLADISMDYKRSCALHYDKLVVRFNYFKKEMRESIWLIKTTSIFIIIDVILSAIITYYGMVYLEKNKLSLYSDLKPWAFGIFSLVSMIVFLIFKYLWQNPKLKKKFWMKGKE